METNDKRLEGILNVLCVCRGVLAVKVLSEGKKREILDVESRVEEKIIFGMCKSLNRGLREALQREFTAAMVIRSTEFQYPHHPSMNMVCDDEIVGEQVNDEKRIKELKKTPGNFFLWEEFVVYVRKLPRGLERRKKMQIVFLPREPLQLSGLSYIENSVFGVPSTEGDALTKRMLHIQSEEAVLETCLVGFDMKKHS